MCYAIPGKVEAINQKIVTVDYYGEKKKAINEFHELSVGDYIYAQGGYVIAKVSPHQAQEVLTAWQELFFKLQEIDEEKSRFLPDKKARENKVVAIFDRVNNGHQATRDDLRYLLALKKRADLELFFKAANFLRQKYHKNACCVHGIIEISNYCTRNCYYCGISCLNKNIKRYRMSKKEILDSVEEAVVKYGFKALVLQSAEDKDYSIDDLVDIVKTIKERHAVLVFVSFGEIGKRGLEKLFEAGSRGLLMRFETSNPKIYEALHPGYSLESRIEELKYAYKLGYLIITGGLIGLPGQTDEDIINDIYLAKDLNTDMYSFSPFIPHPDTPLAKNPPPDEEKVLKTLALVRFTVPKEAKILVTTGFETLSPSARKEGLASGASSVMLNVTPLKYRPLYSIYPARAHEKDSIDAQIQETIELLKSLGRAPTDLGI